MRVRLATRGSTLALAQAQLVADALTRAHPEHDFVLEPLKTHGDRHPALKLSESPREGIFVKELEQALLDGRAELAVHSAKDLPTIETRGLVLGGFLPRADARDVLIGRDRATLRTLPRAARVGTGSPRRAAQIAAVRPDLVPLEIRGNVDTRLQRLSEGVVDALVLAAAGLQRLGRLETAHEVLPFDVMLPAPGQGAHSSRPSTTRTHGGRSPRSAACSVASAADASPRWAPTPRWTTVSCRCKPSSSMPGATGFFEQPGAARMTRASSMPSRGRWSSKAQRLC